MNKDCFVKRQIKHLDSLLDTIKTTEGYQSIDELVAWQIKNGDPSKYYIYKYLG